MKQTCKCNKCRKCLHREHSRRSRLLRKKQVWRVDTNIKNDDPVYLRWLEGKYIRFVLGGPDANIRSPLSLDSLALSNEELMDYRSRESKKEYDV